MRAPARPLRPTSSLIIIDGERWHPGQQKGQWSRLRQAKAAEEDQEYSSQTFSRGVEIPILPPSPTSPWSPSSEGTKDGEWPMSHTMLDYDEGNDEDGKTLTDERKAEQSEADKAPSPFAKPLRFWLIFASLMTVTCLTAVDMTIISTTLPTIVEELPRSNISGSWVTSAFLLTTTAFQPFMGGLSDVVGRRNAIVVAVLLFMAGSVIAAEARTMLILVVGRGVQGVGGGGVQTIAEIVLSDLTTLRERGIFVGLISLVFAVATFIAPVLGGLFSEHDWRWVFWINLPIGAASLAIIIPSMKLKTPQMPLMAKIHRMDIGANAILFASVVAILIALTDGGIAHPWSSWRILLPFAAGWAGLCLFFAIELVPNRFVPDPVLPRRLFANRTAATCFIMTFVHGLLTYGLIYLLPLYFQSVRSSSPLRSAIELFPATAPGPFAAIFAGILMATSGKYRAQIWVWWSITLAGCGLLCLLSKDTPTYQWVIFQLIPGFGVGALFTLTLPPIQASLPIDELAHATATFAFCRSFGSVWGIALGTNVFISVVNGKLAGIDGLAQQGLTGSTALGYATELHRLPAMLQEPARDAFMAAIRTSLYVFCPAALAGLMISFFVEELPLPDFNESKHGLQDDVDMCDAGKTGRSMSREDHRSSYKEGGTLEKVALEMPRRPDFQRSLPSHHHLRNRSVQRMSTIDSYDSRYNLRTITDSLHHQRQPYLSGYAL